MRGKRTASLASLFILAISGQTALGLDLDARKVGMGGVFLCADGCASQYNPAYLALPRTDAPLTIPLPLGLIQLANNFPVLDTNDPDFDPIYLTNLLLNPPFHLQLVSPEFTTTDAAVEIDIRENYLMIDLNELQTYIPTSPVDPGIYGFRSPRFGMRFGNFSVSASPYFLGEVEVALSDNLVAALSEAEPFAANSRYNVLTTGNFAAMAAVNASHGRKLPFDLLGEENPIYVGLTAKYLMGWAYVDTETEVAIETGDPVFGTEAPPEVAFTSVIRSSHPEGGSYSPTGRGFGFDMGVLAKMGKMEVGLGIQDIYSRVTWEAEVERWTLDPETNEINKETLVPFEHYRQQLPRTFTLSLAYTNGISGTDARQREGYTVATNMDVFGGDLFLNLGTEFYVRSFPVRAGVFNESGKMQVSFGTAVPIYFGALDLGFATHNRTLSGAKGLYMATTLRFGEW
jgi:hypothetical protein